jgi:hypothetical protein
MKKTNECNTGKTYFYKQRRGSLVDVICDELTYGEEVYVLSSNGKYIPTTAPSLLIDEYHVSTDWDDNDNCFIWVQVEDEETQNRVVEVANKYGKASTTKFDRFAPIGSQYQVKISIEETDFDGHYYDDKVTVRPKKAS